MAHTIGWIAFDVFIIFWGFSMRKHFGMKFLGPACVVVGVVGVLVNTYVLLYGY